MKLIAHRGYSALAPENTLAAFALALEHGADGVEFDVHFTADGVPVVIHDEDVRRTTNGAGLVAELTLADVRTLDAGAWLGERFAGERVPTLDQLLALLRGRGLRIFPEIKGHRGAADLAQLIARLDEHGLLENSALLAFDWRDLDRVREISDTAVLGYEVDRAAEFGAALAACVADGRACISCRADVLLRDPALAVRAAAENVEIAAWTVNDVDSARALLAQGVTTLMTDDLALRARL